MGALRIQSDIAGWREWTAGVLQHRRITKGLIASASVAATLVVSHVGAAAADEMEVIRAAGFSPRNLGYVVVDERGGRIVRSYQADRHAIPASIIKLFTAWSALEVLGPDFRFVTPVLAEKSRAGLHLHLSGGGDPVLVEEDIAALASVLKTRVAREPVVRFTYDSAALPFISMIDPADDVASSYNPPIAALSVNFNRQWLKWEAGPDRKVLKVSILPDLGHVAAGIASFQPADGRSVQFLDGAITKVLLEPRVAGSGRRQIAVRQPALRTALMLHQFAGEAGLSLPWPEEDGQPHGATVIASHASRPMVEIADALLRFSNNLAAELVGLKTAVVLGARPLTLQQSASVVREWTTQRVPQLNAAGPVWPNLSGLSGDGWMTPAEILAFLWYVHDRTYGGRRFFDLLPAAEWVKPGEPLAVRAKSGTMSFSRGAAGEFVTKDGRPFLFVIMHTDPDARARFEADPLRFSDDVRSVAGRWGVRAREMERSLLRYWAGAL
jgi:serine-type D-Ala-D-Ala carboxypeptidase/endopeptidase (penicillin-binding protein 4)